MKSRLVALITVGILTFGVAAYAHHSFAGILRRGQARTD